MRVIWTNGEITITKDLVFGVSVLAAVEADRTVWVPLTQMDLEDLSTVSMLIDNDTSCPWLDEIRDLISNREEAEFETAALEAEYIIGNLLEGR